MKICERLGKDRGRQEEEKGRSLGGEERKGKRGREEGRGEKRKSEGRREKGKGGRGEKKMREGRREKGKRGRGENGRSERKEHKYLKEESDNYPEAHSDGAVESFRRCSAQPLVRRPSGSGSKPDKEGRPAPKQSGVCAPLRESAIDVARALTG